MSDRKQQFDQSRNGHRGQQVQVGADLNAAVVGAGGIHIGDGNSGITITSVGSAEEPEHHFEVAKMTKIPASTSVIGVASGLVTLLGFGTGAFSVKELISLFQSGSLWTSVSGRLPEQYGWLLSAVVLIVLGVAGFQAVRFLSRHVLWLPKSWRSRAWAGIKDENGRTYPYLLRLEGNCPKCADRKLRFQRIPWRWVDFFNSNGERTKRKVTEWMPVAACPRNSDHTVRVDISGNDFDEAIPRF